MSEIGIQITVPCGPEGAAILSALAKAFAAPTPDLTATQDHLAHTAAVNTHMLPQQLPAAPVTPSAQTTVVGQAFAQGFQQPPSAPSFASQQAAAPVAPPALPASIPTAAPDYPHEQLSRAAGAFLDKSPASRPQLLALLQQFGVPAITALATPDARTAFAAELRKLGVQI